MFENNKNIWVYIETEEGKPKAVGFELLSPGRDIADKRGCSLVAVVIGNGVEETANRPSHMAQTRFCCWMHQSTTSIIPMCLVRQWSD